ncbi:DUF3833 domain-containing protein [Crenobacter luteus]|uniref:Lipoprotein n=1 Tax=Crenobacter luteus TaxID=1452487 RepID=A0A165F5L0_9NEIS|nr:DUF3833 domain-containing protein [Crenobacter luteus]KZE31478.1 hypothetical protein AVW16_11945 [Crenobacter luteus]
MKTDPFRSALLSRRWWPVVALLLLLPAGCGSARLDDYRGTRPQLDLVRYFDGPITAWGMFQDRSGKVIRRFTVQIDAHWKGDTGTIDERFVYDDGERRRRVWTVKKGENGEYTGTASDVVGVARGKTVGYALRWAYTLKLQVGDKEYEVDFDDWMYQVDAATMINRSEMKKFGLRLGEVTLFFRKGPRP